MFELRFFHFLSNYNRVFKKDSINLISSFKNLDNELPNNSWPKSCLIELLSNNSIEKDINFIIPTLIQIIRKNRKIIIFSNNIYKHYNTLLLSGIPENLIMIIDSQSSIDKILKLNMGGKIPIGAVIGWIDNKHSFISLQKIQACLKTSNAFSFLFRPLSTKDKPSPAPLRITLENIGLSKIRLMVLKRRGPTVPKKFDVDLSKKNVDKNCEFVIFNKRHKLLNKYLYDYTQQHLTN